MYIKDRLRRSMMFVPGNNPGMIRDAHIYGADSIMFDLEDSVAYTEKDAARFLVHNALKTLDFGKKEIVVRINDLSSGLGIQDLEAIVPAGVHVVRLPKTDCAQDVIDCEKEIARIEAISQREMLGFTDPRIREVRVMGGCTCVEVYDEATLEGFQQFAYERGVFSRPFLKYMYSMVPYVIQEEELVHIFDVMKEWFRRG